MCVGPPRQGGLGQRQLIALLPMEEVIRESKGDPWLEPRVGESEKAESGLAEVRFLAWRVQNPVPQSPQLSSQIPTQPTGLAPSKAAVPPPRVPARDMESMAGSPEFWLGSNSHP